MTRRTLVLAVLALALPAQAQVAPQAEAPDGAMLFRHSGTLGVVMLGPTPPLLPGPGACA